MKAASLLPLLLVVATLDISHSALTAGTTCSLSSKTLSNSTCCGYFTKGYTYSWYVTIQIGI
jgi:hypothetical protein